MPGSKINGWTVGYTAIGGIVLWSGISGTSLTTTFQDLLKGQAPSQNQETIATNTVETSSGSGSTPVTATGGNPASSTTEAVNQAQGRLLAATFGWTGAQWTALNNIVMAESGWNNQAQNPGSTAYGIGQFLDTTWATVGYTKTSDSTTQIIAMLNYIKQRYGTPENAWAFHLANGYY